MRASPFEPELIEVAAPSGGPPQRVKIGKRVQKVGQVVNLWRIDDCWWRSPVSRLYYVLEMESGSRITVFRDLIGGAWYRQNWSAP